MALEDLTGTSKFIDDFVNTNPVGSTDFKSTLDDHIRGLKNVLLNQFPNLTAAVTPDADELNKLAGLLTTAVELGYVTGVTSAIQAQIDLKAALADPDFTGVLDSAGLIAAADALTVALTATISGNLILNAGYNEDVINLGTGGNPVNIDLDAATAFYMGTLITIPTFVFQNPASSGRMSSFNLELNNASNFLPVWPVTVRWADNDTEPTWTAGKDVVGFTTRNGGSDWLGFLGGLDLA